MIRTVAINSYFNQNCYFFRFGCMNGSLFNNRVEGSPFVRNVRNLCINKNTIVECNEKRIQISSSSTKFSNQQFSNNIIRSNLNTVPIRQLSDGPKPPAHRSSSSSNSPNLIEIAEKYTFLFLGMVRDSIVNFIRSDTYKKMKVASVSTAQKLYTSVLNLPRNPTVQKNLETLDKKIEKARKAK